MVKSVSKVIYKPDSQSTDEYMAYVDPEQYKKWLEGETSEIYLTHINRLVVVMLTGSVRSIPLVDVVDSFDIFHSGQGAQGYLGKASKQEIAAAFDEKNETEALQILLQKGALQKAETIKQHGDTNQSRGARITSAGAVGGGR
ncbi:hypothetical protein FS837_006402 [Tulasnella sp. UAMH 9824]|nr:hypothetical protein FS837_006402 [Tulasnella sp. UAMH 9824]